jgi:tetratricopeptide (TPR) repeat protein
VFRLARLCAVIKTYVAAGQIEEAEGILDSVKSGPEWPMLLSYIRTGHAPSAELTVSKAEDEAEPGEEHEEETEEEDDEGVFVNPSDATDLAEALHLLGHEQEAQSFAQLALAMMLEDQSLGDPADVEFVATLLATSGQLRERTDDFDKVIDGQTHSYQAVGLLAAVARAALKSGDHALAHELLAKALKSARLGGRIACFELISGFRSVFRTLGVPDLEWVIFETCEEVDAWWQPVTT